jgi:hypothetical protein
MGASIRKLQLVDATEFATPAVELVSSKRLQQTTRLIGGVRIDAGVFDLERNERCHLSVLGRCYPAAGIERVLSRDASCTPAFATVGEYDRCSQTDYRLTGTGCENREWRRIAEPIATPATLYAADAKGTCVANEGAALVEKKQLHVLGPPVRESEFAEHQVVNDE